MGKRKNVNPEEKVRALFTSLNNSLIKISIHFSVQRFRGSITVIDKFRDNFREVEPYRASRSRV